MGIFLNRGYEDFESALNSQIYVDKTDVIAYFNRLVKTEQRYVCASRPRRFGKSITANMLAAYYVKGVDSEKLFAGRKLADTPDWKKYLNKYNVIQIDMADVCASIENPQEALDFIKQGIVSELNGAFPNIIDECCNDVVDALAKINGTMDESFIIIIDEWDAFFRNEKCKTETQVEYVDLLRGLFKGNRAKKFTSFAYITGILPIKKYNSESALNNFTEYTMISPKTLAPYIGFTESEVKALCEQYHMDYEKMGQWYDGYSFGNTEHIYGPNSVVQAMLYGNYENYWSQTVVFNSLTTYITMNFDGLKDAIVELLGDKRVWVDTFNYANDMTSFASRDDVLTVLIHLGYLAYDAEKEEVYIPNYEVRQIFERNLKNTGWDDVVKLVDSSRRLLADTLAGNEEAVARQLDECHMANVSIMKYNDENSLSCVITLAYYYARNEYELCRELPSGYGYADVVFVPKKGVTKPAVVVELKCNESAQSAIAQIKTRRYAKALEGRTGDVVLAGINYDKKTKKHSCTIERISVNEENYSD